MDPLTDILQDLRLKRSFYARSDLRAPWGLAFSAQNGPGFHAIVSGQCWLRVDTQKILLHAGDLVLLPHGIAHQLASTPEGPALSLEELPSERIGHNVALLSYDGDGERSLLICGGVQFAGAIAHPLLEHLPQVLLLHSECEQEQQQKSIWLDATLTMLSSEALSLRPGSVAVMTRLADILVLQTIRAWLEKDENRQHGWLAASCDPDIGHVLALIHHRAGEAWSVSSLAAEVHLSRSVFAERFSRLVGMTPMQYVTRWRMHLASSWMHEDHLSLSEVASRLGYSSEAAFSRAFKRHMQISPGAMRRGI